MSKTKEHYHEQICQGLGKLPITEAEESENETYVASDETERIQIILKSVK